MLDVIRKGQRWLTAIFVVGIGGVFAVFSGVGSPLKPAGDSVMTVGRHKIGAQEFLRTRQSMEERFRQAFGDSFDPNKLSDAIDANTAAELQQRAILALEAEDLGLTVAKEEVERELLAYDGLRDASGNFSREAFEKDKFAFALRKDIGYTGSCISTSTSSGSLSSQSVRGRKP